MNPELCVRCAGVPCRGDQLIRAHLVALVGRRGVEDLLRLAAGPKDKWVLKSPVCTSLHSALSRGCDGRMRSNGEWPSAQQFILQSARKPLRLNTPILGYFTAKSLYRLIAI